jgi:hypothetical protein
MLPVDSGSGFLRVAVSVRACAEKGLWVDQRNPFFQSCQNTDGDEASVWLPHALDRKYPLAHAEFKWQFLVTGHGLFNEPSRARYQMEPTGILPFHLSFVSYQ